MKGGWPSEPRAVRKELKNGLTPTPVPLPDLRYTGQQDTSSCDSRRVKESQIVGCGWQKRLKMAVETDAEVNKFLGNVVGVA